MRRHIFLAVTLAAAIPAAPAYADVPYAVTPSGRTEAIFDLAVVDTSDRIANGCANVGWTLVNSTPTMVVCQIQMSTMQSVLTALAIGNSYSTPPKHYLRFNIAGLNQRSRVQATGWIETQMAFGQTRTGEMTAAHYHNNVMGFFQGLGGHLPPGTSFPNHAYIGSNFEATSNNQGVRVAAIEPESPAQKAGLQPGDILVRLAKEKIKSGDDILDGLRKASKDPSYEVEILRNGKTVKVAMGREYRRPISEADLPELPAPPQPQQLQAVAALSQADELAKFAKLRDDGVISSEEFEKMKAKILGGE